MKPVNLYPHDRPSGDPTAPNTALIGGAAGLVVVGLIVVAFFAFSRVDTIKSETGKLNADAASAQQETTAVQAQITSIGEPVMDADRQLAQNAEQTLVSVYRERVDFQLMADELNRIMPKVGWYTEIRASAIGSVDAATNEASSVIIQGFLPTPEMVASFNERVESTRTFKDAKTVKITSKKLRHRKTRKLGRYFEFKIVANLVDTVIPYSTTAAPTDSAGGSLVGNGSSDALTLSLDPEAVVRKATRGAAAPAAPTNPLALAAGAAAGGTP